VDHAPSPYTLLAYRRAFTARDPKLVQLSFSPSVLDKYRASKAFTLIRSDTAGRISKEGGWTIDVGIANGTIHASLGDVLDNLPDDEREHWAAHVLTPRLSEKFLQMRLSAGACINDGDARPWE
jgi:hypothetical protein